MEPRAEGISYTWEGRCAECVERAPPFPRALSGQRCADERPSGGIEGRK